MNIGRGIRRGEEVEGIVRERRWEGRTEEERRRREQKKEGRRGRERLGREEEQKKCIV
jgi:hypothetical protein